METKREVSQTVLRAAALAMACFAVPVTAAGPDPGVNVTVTNPPSKPVPVTGAVTGTVSLAPGTGVIIDNPVTDPVRVRNVSDAMQPVAVSAFCSSQAAIGCSPGTFYKVPTGKRLVIEYASYRVCLLPGQATGMKISTTAGGNAVNHYLDSAPAGAGPGSFNLACNSVASTFAARGQQVRLYADADTFVGVEGQRDTPVGNAAFELSISGYLVDVPLTP